MPDSGKETTLHITAGSAAEAVRTAQRDGYMVASVTDAHRRTMSVSEALAAETAALPAQAVALDAIANSPLIKRPIRTIAAGVLVGTLAIAGLLVVAYILAGIAAVAR